MRDGFVRVAAGTPALKLADCKANAEEIVNLVRAAHDGGAKLLVLPELCLTGASCGDLFLQDPLIAGAQEALMQVVRATEGLSPLVVLGLPLRMRGRLYNCAAVILGGEILGIMPKPRPGIEEGRWFDAGEACGEPANLFGDFVPFGTEMVFGCTQMEDFQIGVEWLDGQDGDVAYKAHILACPFAVPEWAGVGERLNGMLTQTSRRFVCGCVGSGAGVGESSTDQVYGGRRLIAECGKLLESAAPHQTGLIFSELDVSFLAAERRRQRRMEPDFAPEIVEFSMPVEETTLTRRYDQLPFVPKDDALRAERCEQILGIQVQGLVQRMRHTGCPKAVLGVSGGLDSTLAMLVAARALGALGLPKDNLICVTMPCFGTTQRTKGNALALSGSLGGTLLDIDITASVTQHFKDIGHDINRHDVTFENAQARERTQILMDIANQQGALVVGTGNMSELALGWATYNGDHMSMYGVNAGVPKTLVRHLVRYVADSAQDENLGAVLRDVLDTPISPELLPPEGGNISQRTEDLIGPYELHDFFLYHMQRRMASPEKILRLAVRTFSGCYDAATVHKWLTTFMRRFFSQQFKRSCLPDGPRVGSVSLSPRGALSMPSDANARLWLDNIPMIENSPAN